MYIHTECTSSICLCLCLSYVHASAYARLRTKSSSADRWAIYGIPGRYSAPGQGAGVYTTFPRTYIQEKDPQGYAEDRGRAAILPCCRRGVVYRLKRCIVVQDIFIQHPRFFFGGGAFARQAHPSSTSCSHSLYRISNCIHVVYICSLKACA